MKMATKSLLTCAAAAAIVGSANAATLIENNFDGVADDIGPGFQKVDNGSGGAGTFEPATGTITTGTGTSSAVGFNNTALVDVTAGGATGFVATFEISSVGINFGLDVNSNGYFFGIVSGTNATGTAGNSLYNNDPLAFGYVPRSANFGDNVVIEGIDFTDFTATAGPAPAATDASFADGFTLTFTLNDDNTWTATSTGLSNDLNASGTLGTEFDYATFVSGGVGLYASLQTSNGRLNESMVVDRVSLTTIPEPGSLALLGLGGLLLARRRRG